MKFKDKCDQCNNFDYLKSFNNKCLCSNCLKILNIPKNKKMKYKQLTIYDVMEDKKKND